MQLRVFLALIPLALALASPACAQQVADGGTLDRILPDIRAAHPGRLSDAEPWIDENGRTHYRIKWMTPEGRILYFDADARTGRYSSTGGERDGGARPADRTQGESPDNHPSTDDRGRGHDNWNSEPNPYGSDGGPRRGGGDAQGSDVPRDQGRGGDRRGGDWRNNGDRRGNGDWRGGHDAGDSGGGRHHGHGGF